MASLPWCLPTMASAAIWVPVLMPGMDRRPRNTSVMASPLPSYKHALERGDVPPGLNPHGLDPTRHARRGAPPELRDRSDAGQARERAAISHRPRWQPRWLSGWVADGSGG